MQNSVLYPNLTGAIANIIKKFCKGIIHEERFVHVLSDLSPGRNEPAVLKIIRSAIQDDLLKPVLSANTKNIEHQVTTATAVLSKQYGCTLMVYVQTFHIGDSKCLSFQESPIWSEPIPWDDKCFLNKMLANEGQEATDTSLKQTLPQLSKIGSKDDMSVACVSDEEALSVQIVKFIQYQIDLVVSSIREADAHIKAAEEKLAHLRVLKFLDKKTQIDIQYAKQDIEKYKEECTKLLYKHDSLFQQLSFILTKSLNN